MLQDELKSVRDGIGLVGLLSFVLVTLLLGTGLHLAIGAPARIFASLLYILCAGSFAVAARYFFGERRIGALLDRFSATECANYVRNAGYAAI